MKKLLASLSLIIAVTTSSANAAPTPNSFADLVEKLSPAVVNISTTQVVQAPVGKNAPLPGTPMDEMKEFYSQRSQSGPTKPMKTTSLGSGFIISSSGYIITNNHVVASGTDISVTLHDDTKLKAKLIGNDTKIDIAVLKVEAGKPLPYVKLGNSDIMRVGDWVLAIGNPYGLGGTVTAGIISARARDINVGPFDDFLQTDAAINRGNSGGPMFNTDGDVVGINTAIFSPSGGNVGIGFATPSSLAKPVIEQIIKYGKAKRGWLGLKIQTVTDDIAKSLGLKTSGGALVLEVVSNSPAGKVGIKEGDVILKFANQEVAAMRKLPRIVAETELGKEIPVEIFRNGKVQVVKVVLTEITPEQEKAENTTLEDLSNKTTAIKGQVLLGMKLVEINPDIRTKYKLAHDKGLYVADVSGNSNAFENGVRSGLVIVKAGDKEVANVAQLNLAISEAKKQSRPSILLLFKSGSGSEERFIPVNLK